MTRRRRYCEAMAHATAVFYFEAVDVLDQVTNDEELDAAMVGVHARYDQAKAAVRDAHAPVRKRWGWNERQYDRAYARLLAQRESPTAQGNPR